MDIKDVMIGDYIVLAPSYPTAETFWDVVVKVVDVYSEEVRCVVPYNTEIRDLGKNCILHTKGVKTLTETIPVRRFSHRVNLCSPCETSEELDLMFMDFT